MVTVRHLQQPDKEALAAFLSGYAESSMFLLSNMAVAGIDNPHVRYGGDYWGMIDDAGRIVGVIAHYSNGNVMLQAPQPELRHVLLHEVRRRILRPVAGVVGPDVQVTDALKAFSLGPESFAVNRGETLFHLPCDRLIVPELPPADTGKVMFWGDIDPDLLQSWLLVYREEALGQKTTDRLRKDVAHEVEDAAAFERSVLILNSEPVALAGFNARLPEMVQVGSVFTPPEQRSQGYARYLIGAMLKQAFDEGVQKAILFTDSPAAERAYRSLGFEPIGDYRLAILRDPVVIA